MKQVLQVIHGGKTRLADVPEPSLRDGGVLVRTHYSLISAGTERMIIDLAGKSLLGKARERPDHVRKVVEKVRRDGLTATWRAVKGRLSDDLPLGYSAAGEVVEVGRRVDDLSVGRRVACAGAGYATHSEFLFVPRNLCAPVPESVSNRHAAMATLGAIALQGVRTADLRLGEVGVVLGLGLLGQLSVQFLRASGVRVVAVDLDPSRVELARGFGAEAATTDAAEAARIVGAMTRGHGADAVIVAAATSSNGPLATAADLCRKRGVVSLVGAVGMELDRRVWYAKELRLLMSTSYGPGRYDPRYEEGGIDYPYSLVRWTEGRNLSAFLQLAAEGALDLDPLITHEFGIDEAEAAYGIVTGETKEPHLGILLGYPLDGDQRSPTRAERPRAGGTQGKVGIGMLGAGAFAKGVLLPALAGDGRVRFANLVTSSGGSAAAVQQTYGFAAVAADAAEVVDDPGVDAVLVLTRHDSHAELVQRALAAGKPCFVEKPLALVPDELSAVEQAMAERPGLVCVGFNRRFAPSVLRLRDALSVRKGAAHASYRVHAGALPADHWTRDPDIGGGRVVGECCHFVDLLIHVVGKRAVRVRAERVGEDGIAALLWFEDESTATLEYLTAAAPSLPKERLEVHWSGRSYVLDDFRSLQVLGGGKPRKLWSGAQDKGHRTEMQRFVDAVVEGGPSPVPFDEAVHASWVTFGLEEAIRTGTSIEVRGR